MVLLPQMRRTRKDTFCLLYTSYLQTDKAMTVFEGVGFSAV